MGRAGAHRKSHVLCADRMAPQACRPTAPRSHGASLNSTESLCETTGLLKIRNKFKFSEHTVQAHMSYLRPNPVLGRGLCKSAQTLSPRRPSAAVSASCHKVGPQSHSRPPLPRTHLSESYSPSCLHSHPHPHTRTPAGPGAITWGLGCCCSGTRDPQPCLPADPTPSRDPHPTSSANMESQPASVRRDPCDNHKHNCPGSLSRAAVAVLPSTMMGRSRHCEGD